ncbi:MAG: hypothetical protein ACFFCO_02775 [Promethearchaeota archaeon]
MTFVQRLDTFPRKSIVIGAVLFALISFLLLVFLFQSVEAAVAPTGYGILDLEFAWTASQATIILAAWGPLFIPLEIQGVYLDFAFIPSYVTLVAGLILLLTRRFTGCAKTLGFGCVLATPIAGLLDVVENLNLLTMMSAPTTIAESIPFTASLCATIKFALLIATISYFLLGLLMAALSKLLPRKP